MHIIIVGAAMPFGPDSLRHRSLGGSETAQLMMGKELAKRGHEVWQITALPTPDQPDFIQPGTVGADGVRYISAENWQQMVCGVPHDLLVISRDIRLAGVPHQAKFCAYWAHDLATHSFMSPGLQANGWNIDEVWAVSEYHADQIHAVTGFPRVRIHATRNGIVDVKDADLFDQFDFDGTYQHREANTLFYAARPERGLLALVREGGIMERLPEFKLRVAMYANFPDHMRDFYAYIQNRINALPNVQFVGSLTQPQVRSELAQAAAYVYPTEFEETSCILAREACEQGTPFLTGRVGALPETLGDCALYFNDFMLEGAIANVARRPIPEWNTDEYCEKFAAMVRWFFSDKGELTRIRINDAMSNRDDLYWSGVVDDWIERYRRAQNLSKASDFSLIRSLVEDGNVIPALDYIQELEDEAAATGVELPWQVRQQADYLRKVYHFVDYDDEQMGAYYEAATKHWTEKYPGQHQADPVHDAMLAQQRHAFVVDHIRRSGLPDGATIFEYGIAEGNLILNLARTFPQYRFVGCDFDELALEKAREYAAKHGITNFRCFNTLEHDPTLQWNFDMVICCEVLEHVRYPWKHLDKLEAAAKPGADIVLSTPFGAWEAMQWSHFGHDFFRQHIWEFKKSDYEEMVGHKRDLNVVQVSCHGGSMDGRIKGHFCTTYKADDQPARPLTLSRMRAEHHIRESTTACIITMNGGSTLPRLFDSLWQQVDAVQIAVGPSQDNTMEVIEQFHARYPWLPLRVIAVPKIIPREFGFDDARNASIEGISTEWYLWIDSDEYLAGNIKKYVRSNALDAYAVSQHHFTVEPKGAPPQIDRPARLCRNHLVFFGKVHEHAETEMNKGPGYSILVPDVDIGHTGYVNELVRKARFERNFPFLEWDREVNPDRNLGAYLWFRDILHRLRYAHEAGNFNGARALAEEALVFYKEKYEAIMRFGMGGPTALGYFSEAMRYLGRGRDVRVVVSLDGHPVDMAGRVEDTSEILPLIEKMLGPELEKSRSKYWR